MKKLILSIMLSGLALSLDAQALQCLLIPQDAREAALAGSGAALDAGAFATDRNIAAAALSERNADFGVSYNNWAPGSSQIGIAGFGGWYRAGRLAFGLSGAYCIEQPYEILSGVSRVTGTFTPKDFKLGLGAAFLVTETLSLGASLRMASSSIAEKASGTAFGADISAMYAADGLRAALGVRNLGTQIKYGKNAYSQPAHAMAGASYSTGAFTACAEADYLFAGALMASLGAEYCVADIVSLRAGFHYGDAQKALPTHASLGLGLQLAGVSLDAAFLTASKVIGNSFVLSLGYSF